MLHNKTNQTLRGLRSLRFHVTRLAITLAIALLTATTAWAQYSGGSGTEADPFRINSQADLNTLATNVNNGEKYNNMYFKQTANITLTSAWTPIGTDSSHPFKGHYDGGGYTISGLTVSGSYQYAGLFGYISSDYYHGSQIPTELKNINIVNCNIDVSSAGQGNGKAAGIASFVSCFNMSNCKVSGTIKGYDYAAGLIGQAGSFCKMNDCFADVTVDAHKSDPNAQYPPAYCLIGQYSNNMSASGNYYHDNGGNVSVSTKSEIIDSATPVYTVASQTDGLTLSGSKTTSFNGTDYYASGSNLTLTVNDDDKAISAVTVNGTGASSSVAANKKSATVTVGTGDVTVSATLQTISGTTADGLSWSLAQDNSGNYTCLTVGGNGAMQDYGYTTVGSLWRTDAPWGWQTLTSVTIGDGVTAIGSYAFIGCQSLATATIGSSVTEIAQGAFDHCDALVTVTLPASVTTLGQGAFKNCVGLQRIDIGHDGDVSLAANVFQNDNALQYITFPSPAALLANTTGNWSTHASKLRVTLGNQLFTATTEGGTPAYQIATADDLRNLAAAVNATKYISTGKTFRQTADIDLASGGNFTPIGEWGGGYSFVGTYDGGGYTISGLTVSINYGDIGLFGVVKGATVSNVILLSPTVKATTTINYVVKLGALIGMCDGGSSNNLVENCHVVNPTVSNSSTSSSNYVGAIIGNIYSKSTTVTNCYYYGGNATAACGYIENGAPVTNVCAAHLVTPADGVTIQTPMDADLGFSCDSDNDGTAETYYREGAQLTLNYTGTVPEGYTLSFSANGTALSGNTYTVNATDGDVTIAAAIRSDGQPHTVAYINADGTEHEASAIALDGHEAVNSYGNVRLAGGTYYVGTDIAYANRIMPDGAVTLILADGKTMTLNGNTYGIDGYNLTIYGQSLDAATAGTLRYDGKSYGIHANNYEQHSGNVSITTTGFLVYGIDAPVTLRGGTLTVSAAGTDACAIYGTTHSILGGQLTATATGTDAIGIDAWASIDTALTLGWTRPDDRITVSSISTEGGTVAVADGQALTEGNGHIYTGTLTNDEISAIAGKTLRPCISYLDSDGKTKTCTDFTLLTGKETELDNTDGWYVAAGTLNYDHTLTLSANVNLILTDGCQMNFGTSESRLSSYGIDYTNYPDFNIYSQSKGDNMGALSVYTTGDEIHGIRAHNIFVNGGNITANADGDEAYGIYSPSDGLTVNGGNVTATATGTEAIAISLEYSFTINGGSVTATGNGEDAYATSCGYGIFVTGGTLVANGVLGAVQHILNSGIITANDGIEGSFGIYLNGATVTASSYSDEVKVGEGLFYTDGEGNYYYGVLTSSEMSAIAGKTLSPSQNWAVSLADTDAEQNQKLTALDGMTLDVILSNRTIDTEWNTIALPFGVSAEQLTETFGEGVKLYELTGSSLADGVLGLEFTSATSIEAGKPYFIKASADVQNPTFSNVTIDALANNTSWTGYVDFIPTLGVTKVEGSDLREVLVLGAGNTLYNPYALPAMMKGFRGFFRVHDEVVDNAAQFRMSFEEESDVTGIIEIKNEELKMNNDSDAVYNLMGQKVKNASAREIHVVKGKRVIIQ